MPLVERAIGLLGAGVDNKHITRQLDIYVALIQRWNAALSLVSAADVDRLEEHIADSLSLTPYIASDGDRPVYLLDIGSGAGFPAIPLKLALPSLVLTMVERSEKKCTFLGTCVRTLGLAGVTLLNAPFHTELVSAGVYSVTCRALERPEELAPALERLIRAGSRLLCQSERLEGSLLADFPRDVVEDEWTAKGLRRGRLTLISSTEKD